MESIPVRDRTNIRKFLQILQKIRMVLSGAALHPYAHLSKVLGLVPAFSRVIRRKSGARPSRMSSRCPAMPLPMTARSGWCWRSG